MPVTKSILRYPGGKTQLSKFVNHLISINNLSAPIYCEPFSGGSGVSMELLLNNKVNSIILNDYDPAIYSVWYAILNETERFTEDIANLSITINEWFQHKETYNNLHTIQEYNYSLALSTLFLNRTNRAGIIMAGPIGGYNQKSKYTIDCRFNKQNIIKKINTIATQSHRIQLYMLDAKELIRTVLLNLSPQNLFTFFDPPYYKQGHALYKNAFNHLDHINLYNAIREMDGYRWITTYDCCPEIQEIYNQLLEYTYQLQYSANSVRKEKEYLYGSPITKLESFDKVILE